LCALFENTKEKFKTYWKNVLKYWKRKKKRSFISLLGFGQVQQQPDSAPRLSPTCASRFSSLRSLGPSLASRRWPSFHACTLSFLSLSLMSRTRTLEHLLPPHIDQISFPCITRLNPPP
jgi:hypothetical protein